MIDQSFKQRFGREPDIQDRLEDYLTDMGGPASPVSDQRPVKPLPSLDEALAEADVPEIEFVDPQIGIVIFNLLHRLRVDGEVLDRITMRHPTLGEMGRFIDGEISRNGMMELLTGVPQAVLLNLAWPDAEPILAALGGRIPAINGVATVTGENA